MWGCQFGWDFSCPDWRFLYAEWVECPSSPVLEGRNTVLEVGRCLHETFQVAYMTCYECPSLFITSCNRSVLWLPLDPYSSSKRSTGSFRSPVVFQSCLGEDVKAGHDCSLPRDFHFTAHVIFLCFFHAIQYIFIKCPTNLTSVL